MSAKLELHFSFLNDLCYVDLEARYVRVTLGCDEQPRAALMAAKAELEHALARVEAHLQRLDQPTGSGRSVWEETDPVDRPVDAGRA